MCEHPLVTEQQTFHCNAYFMRGEIDMCLKVFNVPKNFFEFLPIEFAPNLSHQA